MKRSGWEIIWLSVLIESGIMLSISFLLMPLDAVGIFPGIVFWMSILASFVASVVLKKVTIHSGRTGRKHAKHNFCGLSFFSNKVAMVFDVSMPICLLGLVLSLVLADKSGYTCYVFISLTVFSVYMHCVFNNRDYFPADKIKKSIKIKKGRKGK